MICRVSHNIERLCKIISRDFTKILEDFAKYQHTRPIASNSMKVRKLNQISENSKKIYANFAKYQHTRILSSKYLHILLNFSESS